jgi:hypothetical protein
MPNQVIINIKAGAFVDLSYDYKQKVTRLWADYGLKSVNSDDKSIYCHGALILQSQHLGMPDIITSDGVMTYHSPKWLNRLANKWVGSNNRLLAFLARCLEGKKSYFDLHHQQLDKAIKAQEYELKCAVSVYERQRKKKGKNVSFDDQHESCLGEEVDRALCRYNAYLQLKKRINALEEKARFSLIEKAFYQCNTKIPIELGKHSIPSLAHKKTRSKLDVLFAVKENKRSHKAREKALCQTLSKDKKALQAQMDLNRTSHALAKVWIDGHDKKSAHYSRGNLSRIRRSFLNSLVILAAISGLVLLISTIVLAIVSNPLVLAIAAFVYPIAKVCTIASGFLSLSANITELSVNYGLYKQSPKGSDIIGIATGVLFFTLGKIISAMGAPILWLFQHATQTLLQTNMAVNKAIEIQKIIKTKPLDAESKVQYDKKVSLKVKSPVIKAPCCSKRVGPHFFRKSGVEDEVEDDLEKELAMQPSCQKLKAC